MKAIRWAMMALAALAVSGCRTPAADDTIRTGAFVRYPDGAAAPQRHTEAELQCREDGIHIVFTAQLLPGDAEILRAAAAGKPEGFRYEGMDNYEIFVAPDPSGEPWFHFMINSAGATYTHISARDPLLSGEFAWPAAVRLESARIVAEALLPWSLFHPAASAGGVWRVNLCRSSMFAGVAPEERHSSWFPAATAFADPGTFGSFPVPVERIRKYAGIRAELSATGEALMLRDDGGRALELEFTFARDGRLERGRETVDLSGGKAWSRQFPAGGRKRTLTLRLRDADGTVVYQGVSSLADETPDFNRNPAAP